jgi:hypothetical protein
MWWDDSSKFVTVAGDVAAQSPFVVAQGSPAMSTASVGPRESV